MDLATRIVYLARAIDRTTPDQEVDDKADQLEELLTRERIARRSWARELLFCLRSVPHDDAYWSPLLASVDAGHAAGAYSIRVAEVLRALAASRRLAR